MSKLFNPENKKKLDGDARLKLIPPDVVLDAFSLKDGDTLLDIGAGTGYFAIPALNRIGERGRLIAADISEVMLEELKKRLPAKQSNVVFIQCDAEEISQPDDSVDKVLMAFIFHEVGDQRKNLDEVKRLLKEDGLLLIVEWAKVSSPMGPPLNHRIGYDELLSLAIECGFVEVNHSQIGDSIYLSVFKL